MRTKQKRYGVFYHRDSGGKHQKTPPQYVKWTIKKANDLGVEFKGKPEDIKKLMTSRKSYDENIFFDYDVEGDLLSRPALNELFDRLERSRGRITHVFIPDPDRLCRPDNPMEGIALEDKFRRLGVAIVYKNKTLSPLKRGERHDIGELISSIVDHDRAGTFLHLHAEKMVSAKTDSAENGHWAGGRPPYGFRRWLVQDNGTPVRQLNDGETVRQKGNHAEVLPDEQELKTVKRILKLLNSSSASNVCRVLNQEGVPSPDAGRFKTINGVKKKVSGKWNTSTVNGIARNELLVGTLVYGKRSMGKKRRLSNDGPRHLTDDDFRPDGRPRVIQNPKSEQVRGPATFEPIVDPEKHQELLKKLDSRGASQRGKRKCQKPEDNPLGGRITDMACGWPMYKTNCTKKKRDTFKYKCGCYDKSKGDLCEHNCVDGPAAIEFVLRSIQQRIIQPGVWNKLESKIRAIVENDRSADSVGADRVRITSAIAELEERLVQTSRNMALAKKPEHYDAMANVYDTLSADKAAFEDELQKFSQMVTNKPTVEDEIQRALATAKKLGGLDLNTTTDFAMAREVIEATNAQFFAKFRKEKWGKTREVNRIAGGVITFGAVPPPVAKYDGPTDREHLKSLAEEAKRKTAESDGSNTAELLVTSEEAGSLGSKSRADWI